MRASTVRPTKRLPPSALLKLPFTLSYSVLSRAHGIADVDWQGSDGMVVVANVKNERNVRGRRFGIVVRSC